MDSSEYILDAHHIDRDLSNDEAAMLSTELLHFLLLLWDDLG